MIQTPLPDITKAQLPTLNRLGVAAPSEIDALAVAREWFASFAKALQASDASAVAQLCVPDVFWRDLLALTWDFRTFYGTDTLLSFLSDRLPLNKITNVQLNEKDVEYQRPYGDLAWIQAFWSFDTVAGRGSGIVRLVPTPNDGWKAHAVLTNLEELTGHPEKTGPLREQAASHGKWLERRRRETECVGEENQPQVLVIGAGQSGLEIAARLKYLGVKALIVEKKPRVGDLWRTRYEALCLHDTVWYDHMPYLPFPPTWPVYCPAPKLAAWLEHYAETLELDVWLSANITSLTQDPQTLKWTVNVDRQDGSKRTLSVNHVVFAVGIGGGVMRVPSYPGTDKFGGKIIHSGQFTTAKDYIGKKVVVVGACTSAHDICSDFYEHGVDVTMFQRGSTYIMSTKYGIPRLLGGLYHEGADTDRSDRINASFPNMLLKLMHQRVVKDIAEDDKEVLEGLKRVGFRTNTGIDGSGFLILAWSKLGGYYLDVGTSTLIAEGKIKLKNDAQIASFSETGIEFDNGSHLDADVVIFATGYGDAREPYRALLSEEAGAKLKPIWGLDEEGELNSAWRDTGIPRLYCMMGNLALGRFHSKHIALQIKAIEEGIWDGQERYSRA